MGVPSYFAWWVKKYPSEVLFTDFSKTADGKVRLFLDFNSAIHPAVRVKGMSIEEMYPAVYEYLLTILDAVKPDYVFLAVDGVAPAAKITQQRDRRYKSVKNTNHIRSIKMRHGIYDDSYNIDYNMISPGTVFMDELDAYLTSRISKELSDIEFEISNHRTPGEGEHKIMDKIRSMEGTTDTILVYGLDADLIFLTLINHPKTWIVRENNLILWEDMEKFKDYSFLYMKIEVLYEKVIETLSPHYSTEKLQENGFDIKYISYEDRERLSGRKGWIDGYADKNRRLIMDYVYVCSLLGNDFIPRLNCLSIRNGSLNLLIVLYKKLSWKYQSFLVNSDGLDIDRNFFIELMKELVHIEPYLYSQYEIKREKSIRSFKKRLSGLEKHEREIENHNYVEDKYVDTIKAGTKGWVDRYYFYYHRIKTFNSKERKRIVGDICKNYFEMSIWVLRYYQGRAGNWSKTYDYLMAPAVEDIIKYYKEIPTCIEFPDDDPVSEEVQLLSILPPESKNLLPEYLRSYIGDIQSPIAYMYPIDCQYVYYGNKFLHECKAKIPTVDTNALENILKYSKLTL